jgi:group I intron endonuclease
MHQGIIYCATSPSTKKYYGKTVTGLKSRIKGHLRDSEIENHHFAVAIRKYGITQFEWKTVETIEYDDRIELRKKLNERETHWIEKDKTYLREYGYNMTHGGDGGGAFGRTLSEETKDKIRKKLQGRTYSEERCQNMSNGGKGISRGKGNKKSKEHKKHLSESCLGRIISENTKEKMSAAKKGKISWNKGLPAWNKGLTSSEETKKKISDNRKGKGGWNKGNKLDNVTKEKISKSLTGKKQSVETIEKRKKSVGEPWNKGKKLTNHKL